MTYTFAGQFGPDDLRQQNVTTKLLVNATSVAVYNTGTMVLASLFTDRTMANAGANPLALNAPANTAGVDAGGNILFYAAPGTYDVLINASIKFTFPVYPDPADLQAISASDVQSLKDWVSAQIIAATTLA